MKKKIVTVRVSVDVIDANNLDQQLQRELKGDAGAFVSFTGTVRSGKDKVRTLELEHYPAMTKKKLDELVAAAIVKWNLLGVCLQHRVGLMKPGEVIVHICVASSHRKDAYAASMALADRLKSDVPFWKKETGDFGERWVAPSNLDANPKGFEF